VLQITVHDDDPLTTRSSEALKHGTAKTTVRNLAMEQ